jgi:hypothetical protein
MTGIDTIGTVGSVIGTVTGVVALVVSLVTARRSAASDERDRQAIIVVRKVWERQYEDRWPVAEGDADPNPIPATPSQWLVIAPVRSLDDGLVLREATENDSADGDRPGLFTHRIMLEVKNVGRAAATDVVVWCTLSVQILNDLRRGGEKRTYEQSFAIEALPSDGEPHYVGIRSMIALPVNMTIDDVTSSVAHQPIRLSGLRDIRFHPRS